MVTLWRLEPDGDQGQQGGQQHQGIDQGDQHADGGDDPQIADGGHLGTGEGGQAGGGGQGGHGDGQPRVAHGLGDGLALDVLSLNLAHHYPLVGQGAVEDREQMNRGAHHHRQQEGGHDLGRQLEGDAEQAHQAEGGEQGEDHRYQGQQHPGDAAEQQVEDQADGVHRQTHEAPHVLLHGTLEHLPHHR